MEREKKKKIKPPTEWFIQAEYDVEAAKTLLKSGKHIYAIFLFHLSIEKALKGLYAKKFDREPRKTHDLGYLQEEIGLILPDKQQHILDALNHLSVPTRYPDELKKLLGVYKKDRTEQFYKQTKELLLWLKKTL